MLQITMSGMFSHSCLCFLPHRELPSKSAWTLSESRLFAVSAFRCDCSVRCKVRSVASCRFPDEDEDEVTLITLASEMIEHK